MLLNQKSSALGLALFLTTIATVSRGLIGVQSAIAQTEPTAFPLPTSVPPGTTVSIDGSSSMAAINQALKQRFERQFSGSNINLNYSGTPPGLQALRDGKVDLAAIGRPLTEAERNDGLIPVTLERRKIALIVSPDNPFRGSITVPQFAKIVRGEITDWSELGGAPGKIRFVDRPDLSDTRAAFRNYSVFIQSPYQVSSTATRAGEDSTQAVAQQLGKDGLSFAPANHVLNQPSVRIVPMHNTLPTDPRYPFSQPFYYVHKANPAPGVAAFLGYATSESGQETVRSTETDPAALALDPATLLAAGSAAAAGLNSGAGAGSSPASSPAGAASPGSTPGAPDGSQAAGAAPISAGEQPSNAGIPGWLWWLLPLGLAALLLGWLLRNRRSTPAAETPVPPPPPTPETAPPPPPLMTPTETDGSLASRTGSVVTSDRASIAEVQSPTIPPEVAIGGAAVAGAGAASVIRSNQTSPLEPPEVEPQTPVIEPQTPVVNSQAQEVDSELPVVDSQAPVIDSQAAVIDSQVPEVDPQAPVIEPDASPVPVPERPLVELREMPPIEASTFSIEPPEAPPLDETNSPNGAVLGGLAGLGAAGAAAWMSRTRSDEPPQTSESAPLTSLDTIEPFDEVEDAPLDQPPIELDLDDAPTVVDEELSIAQTSAPEYEQLNLDNGEFVTGETLTEPTIVEATTPNEFVTGEAVSAEDTTLTPAEAPVESEPELSEMDAGTDLETAEFAGINAQMSPVEPDTIAEEPPAIVESPQVEETTEAGSPTGIAALGGIGLAAGIAGMRNRSDAAQADVEAARFDVGQTDLSSETLASVDEGLPDLPEGYGESRIVLMPRDPQWAYAYWDIPNEHKSELRNQGGQSLVLRLYDVTDVDLTHQSPHSLQQFECDELARDWYLPIPVSDRDYLVEIGYVTGDGRWLMLARSLPVRVPPVYPSAWEDEQFITVDWKDELRGQTLFTLASPSSDTGMVAAPNGMYDRIFDLSQGAELQRIAGSLFGSMQQVPIESISSYIFPSGIGMRGLPTASGISGMGMSGIGLFSGSAIPIRPRRFWLVADAEIIIYGATEPDATVTIAGETIPLNPDGTFRFQMSFQDGLIDYPILAVAKDGEQTRSIHLKFNRETPSRNTNTKDEAVDEWLSE